jgi:hypothetical protein
MIDSIAAGNGRDDGIGVGTDIPKQWMKSGNLVDSTANPADFFLANKASEFFANRFRLAQICQVRRREGAV